MNEARIGPLLAQEPLASYRPLGAFGRPVHEAYLQIRSVLGTRLGPRYANYFARPNLDQSAGIVRWTADVEGEVRHWTDLTPEEQARRALDLETIRAGLEGYVRQLRETPEPTAGQTGESPRAFASLLEQAVVIPSAKHLHFVGDQPVAAFWGFQELSGDGLNALALRPPAAIVPPAAAAPVAAARRFPWWLLWLLLALLALLFALAWWRCWLPLPFCPAPALIIEERAPGQIGGTPDGVGVIGVPGGTGQTDGAAGTGGTTTPPADGTTPSPGAGTQPPPADGTPPPKEETTPPKAEEPPSQDQKPPASEPPPATPPKPLEIPSDAAAKGDLGFLDGRWRSGQGLVDQIDGKPLEQFYRFDKKGKGEVVVKRGDGTECRAPAQATFDGKNLKVEELSDPRCADGRTYGKANTTCTRDAKGSTICRGKNPDGSTYVVPIEKVP